MSGIVGIVNPRDVAVDRRLLQRMTESLAYRGPDAQEVWADGCVGFGHAMLRTTPEAAHERQPLSLDGQVWITADARVDGRTELIAKLAARGRNARPDTPDAALILHAYHTWGDACLDHLIGDFAFAIWDGPARRLFCARDQFGVKPFYYAKIGGSLLFSNTLETARYHPAVSDRLNDLAIGDFLLFDINQEPSTTSFADIQRLPAAHCMTWSEGNARLRRYWTLPIEGAIRHKRAGDYIEQFHELLRVAVADRLRTHRIGVFMSGGLDSPAVAAKARDVLSEQSKSFDLRAHTTVYDRLFADQERHYSGVVAQALGIPIHYLVVDDYPLYDRWDHPQCQTSEPYHAPLGAISFDLFRQAASFSRVALTGYGLDPALRGSGSYLADELRGFRIGRLVADVGRYVRAHHRPPQLGIRTALRRCLGKAPRHRWRPAYPAWLNPEFVADLDLQERWQQLMDEPPPVHPLRPDAYRWLTAPFWQWRFESDDPGVMRIPLECRYPFFDIRLVRFLLGLPFMPWCQEKGLVRLAMQDVLPECVRTRPKTPLAGNPTIKLLQQPGALQADRFDPVPALSRYVCKSALSRVCTTAEPDAMWVNLRPQSLNRWFQTSWPLDRCTEERRSNEHVC